MTIPFLDLHAAYAELRPEIDAAYCRVMDSGWYILGAEVEAFEQEFAAYCGVRHCIGVGNGLDALHLILRAAGIGPGDEVIVPANTFIATWLAVSYAGATVVPVEPNPASFNLTADGAAAAITPRTSRAHAGPSLRRARRDGTAVPVGGATRSAADRGCGPGSWSLLQGAADRQPWARGGFQLLSGEESRRLRRRRSSSRRD